MRAAMRFTRLAAMVAAAVTPAFCRETYDIDVDNISGKCANAPRVCRVENQRVWLYQGAIPRGSAALTMSLSDSRKHVQLSGVEFDGNITVKIDSLWKTNRHMKKGYSFTIHNSRINNVIVGDSYRKIDGGAIRVLKSDVNLIVKDELINNASVAVRGTFPDGSLLNSGLWVRYVTSSRVDVRDTVVAPGRDITFHDKVHQGSRIVIRRCVALHGDIRLGADIEDSTVDMEDLIMGRLLLVDERKTGAVLKKSTITLKKSTVSRGLRSRPSRETTITIDTCLFGGRGFSQNGKELLPGGHAVIRQPPISFEAFGAASFTGTSVKIHNSVFDVRVGRTPMAAVGFSATLAQQMKFNMTNCFVNFTKHETMAGGQKMTTALFLFAGENVGLKTYGFTATQIHAPTLSSLLISNKKGVTHVPDDANVTICAFKNAPSLVTPWAEAIPLRPNTAPGDMMADYNKLDGKLHHKFNVTCNCGRWGNSRCMWTLPLLSPETNAPSTKPTSAPRTAVPETPVPETPAPETRVPKTRMPAACEPRALPYWPKTWCFMDVEACVKAGPHKCVANGTTVVVRPAAFNKWKEACVLYVSALRPHVVVAGLIYDGVLQVNVRGASHPTCGLPAGHSVTFLNSNVKTVQIVGGAVRGGAIRSLGSNIELRVMTPVVDGGRVEVRSHAGRRRFGGLYLYKQLRDSTVVVEDVAVTWSRQLQFLQAVRRSQVTITGTEALDNVKVLFNGNVSASNVLIEKTAAWFVEILPESGRGAVNGRTNVTVRESNITRGLYTYPFTGGSKLLIEKSEFGGRGYSRTGDKWEGGDSHAQSHSPPVRFLTRDGSMFRDSAVEIRNTLFSVKSVSAGVMGAISLQASLAADAVFRATNCAVHITTGVREKWATASYNRTTLLLVESNWRQSPVIIATPALSLTGIHATGLSSLLANTTSVTVTPEARVVVCAFANKPTALTPASEAIPLRPNSAMPQMMAGFDSLPDTICP